MGKYILTAFLKEKLAKDGWRVCVRNYDYLSIWRVLKWASTS